MHFLVIQKHCLQATYVTKERATFNCKQYKLSLAVYTHIIVAWRCE